MIDKFSRRNKERFPTLLMRRESWGNFEQSLIGAPRAMADHPTASPAPIVRIHGFLVSMRQIRRPPSRSAHVGRPPVDRQNRPHGHGPTDVLQSRMDMTNLGDLHAEAPNSIGPQLLGPAGLIFMGQQTCCSLGWMLSISNHTGTLGRSAVRRPEM